MLLSWSVANQKKTNYRDGVSPLRRCQVASGDYQEVVINHGRDNICSPVRPSMTAKLHLVWNIKQRIKVSARLSIPYGRRRLPIQFENTLADLQTPRSPQEPPRLLHQAPHPGIKPVRTTATTGWRQWTGGLNVCSNTLSPPSCCEGQLQTHNTQHTTHAQPWGQWDGSAADRTHFSCFPLFSAANNRRVLKWVTE